ncbi:hypothetical protein GCM10010124_36520 [Pilimelia terevasa]|uniref:(2Fe-2S) ferredoxin domain-containing protein n=1 Tax=Pilimelia terevasa TaxID=53372 RepID=A0A8J3BUX3_9ACTN|nr:(2Fe-2S) ferredoxin domain-containing protein [Pilimelia terevasa]GGK40446.1 hypothetical protein GCM10010124_36520 [Pilimelia terevasa]
MASGAAETRSGVVLCRGCCCGSAAKHPDVDHAGELADLRALSDRHPDLLTVRTSECLGPCAEANVLVVRPSRTGRRRGGTTVWFSALDPDARAALSRWLADGGPGRAPLPAGLAPFQMHRPRGRSLTEVGAGLG